MITASTKLYFAFAYAASLAIAVQTSAQTPTMLAPNGSWGYNGPHAVYADGKLFMNYITSGGDIFAKSYEVATGNIETGLVYQTYGDLHQAGAIMVRPDGHIHVPFNQGAVYNDGRTYWRVSENPGDVTSFGPIQSSTNSGFNQGRQFFPMVHESTGDLYQVVNYLSGRRQTGMWTSTDGGSTFTQFDRLFGLGRGLSQDRSYTQAYIEGDSIHMVGARVGWGESLVGRSIGRVEGIYYVRYDINTQGFYRADGTHTFNLGDFPELTSADTHLFDTIWHWGNDGNNQQRALWADLSVKDGKPYVTMAVQDYNGFESGGSPPHFGYWATVDDNGEWSSSQVAQLALGWDNNPQRKNYSIAIDQDDPNLLYVAVATNATGSQSQVHRMYTTDNGQTWESLGAISDVGRISTVITPWRLDDTPNPIKALWLEGSMSGWTSYNTAIYAAPIFGDANSDLIVNDLDLAILQANLGSTDADWTMGDFNGDGRVGLADAFILFQNYMPAVDGAAGFDAIPEPTSLALLGIGGLLGLSRRRR
ncbi:MAG: BNR-4 repeat-containing protein [Phycisphaeraceae bacterium]|nr:BNR-4 repeat-containing protein [Phycisphaeraceae bacterium]